MHRPLASLAFVSVLAALFVVAGCSPMPDEPTKPAVLSADEPAGGVVFDATDLRTSFVQIDGWVESPSLEAPEPATRGGLMLDLWDDVADAPIEVEVRGIADGVAGEWVPADITWREAAHLVLRADLGAAVTTTQLRLRVDQSELVEFLHYEAVTPLADGEAAGDENSGIGQSEQPLEPAQSGLKPRSAWGARASSCSSNPDKYRVAIHHTETQPSSSGGYAARLRQIQAFHMDTRGWCDIGYHFLITTDGQIWEGRPLDRLGAHVGNNNTGNVGVSYVGCFHPGSNCAKLMPGGSSQPPQVMIQSGGVLVGQLATRYGISVSSTSVKGHRDHSGASTDCPGDNLHARLEEIRTIAKNPSSTPPPQTPPPQTPPPQTPPPGEPPSSGDWSCSGVAGTTRSSTGQYYVTSFGCWVDSNGANRGDPGDNCIPWCMGRGDPEYEALCGGMSGPDCERDVGWYTAGADRFGCGTRLKVTNPKNGKSAVVAVLDRGPACWVEDKVDHWVLDLSYPASYYLFNEPKAATEKGAVTVVEVSASTPLGPWTGASPPPPPQTPPPQTPPPAGANGWAVGVVWDLSTASTPSASGAVRIDWATVSVDGGTPQAVRAGDAYWKLALSPGTHTIAAAATDYQTATKQVVVTSNVETWSSIGLVP